ncbi:MAG: hypothetical protein ACOYBU_12750, partial [Dermatophilaceae bacterium]
MPTADDYAHLRQPTRDLTPFADAIARLVRMGGEQWSWSRARVVARDRWVSFQDDVVYELADGSEVRPPRSLQLYQVLDRLQKQYLSDGFRAFVVTCVVTPTRVESFQVDTQSDPWPEGWSDPDDLVRLARGLRVPPPWLPARLEQLHPTGSKPPTLAALWTTQAQLLLEDLGSDWEPRGTGAGLRLVRSRSPWLLDVVLFDRSRENLGGRLHVFVVDMLDGQERLGWRHGIEVSVPSLRSPDARRRLTRTALGAGQQHLRGGGLLPGLRPAPARRTALRLRRQRVRLHAVVRAG